MVRYQIWPPMSILDGPHGQATEGPRWGWRPYYRISTEDFIFPSHHIRPHDHSPWMTNVNIAPFWELFPVLIIISVRSQWNHHNLSILNYSVYITIYFPVIKCGHGKSPGCWKGSFFWAYHIILMGFLPIISPFICDLPDVSLFISHDDPYWTIEPYGFCPWNNEQQAGGYGDVTSDIAKPTMHGATMPIMPLTLVEAGWLYL